MVEVARCSMHATEMTPHARNQSVAIPRFGSFTHQQPLRKNTRFDRDPLQKAPRIRSPEEGLR